MTLHELIKQYHNKLIRLIEVLNIHTVKWYKCTTLSSTVLATLAPNGFDACNRGPSLPIKLTVILLVIFWPDFRFHGHLKNIVYWQGPPSWISSITEKKNNHCLCWTATNLYCRQRHSVHGLRPQQALLGKQPRGRNQICSKLIPLKSMMLSTSIKLNKLIVILFNALVEHHAEV